MSLSRNDDETIRKRSGWLIPLGVFAVTFLLSAMFLLLYLAPSAPSLFEEQLAPTSRGDIIRVSVHGRRFNIPAKYMEYASTRQGGERREVALFALVPEMTGWSNWDADTFAGNSPDSPVIYLLLRNDTVGLNETERLKRVYLDYAADERGAPGQFGLTQYAFRPDSGYENQDLFVSQTDSGPVVLLCERLGGNVTSPNCRRDMLVASGVSLTYRFKRSHLYQWRDIAAGVDRLMASFRSAPPKAAPAAAQRLP